MLFDSGLFIPDEELHWSFARSGGPGGQNVNKVASKAILRWNPNRNLSIPEAIRNRLHVAFPNQFTNVGELLLMSERYRDQARNREDCLSKLGSMLQRASVVPKLRKPTKPSKGSKLRRLEDKKQRSERKAGRKDPGTEP